MTPERWRKIEELYHSARERGPSALADADPEIRLEVERLLAEDSGGKLLDRPAADLLDEFTAASSNLAGRTISHYRIIEKLGAGGMGVVWKARDTRLDRFVALKVLPGAMMSDPDRKRRFVLEAKAASALNHPNIVTIYDIDHIGPEEQPADFIVMECVTGKALNQLIPRKGLRLSEALGYAIQIADAMAAAHTAGIVHRDLKPANLMVNEKRCIKVLDFGLAKLTEPGRAGQFTRTGTAEITKTEEGAIFGTVSYMSPEQAEGKKVDARSDIFSFGAVLYEMITGRRAFRGDSHLSTVSAILRDEPQPVTQLCPGLPRELDRLITRCLRKDPARRVQTMADLKVALEDLKADLDSGALAPAPRRRGRLALAWMGLALLVVAMAGAWWWKGRSTEGRSEFSMRQLTADSGLTKDPVLSHDGKLVAYASDRGTQKNLNIWVHPLTEGAQPIRLTSNDADDDSPDFSPDGGLIVFHSNRQGGGIYLIPTFGGDERLLVRGGRSPRFSSDGKWIAYCVRRGGTDFLEESRIYIVPVTGGEARQLAADVPWASAPVFSGDGKYIVFEGADAVNDLSSHDWWVAPVAGGQSVRTGAMAALAGQKFGPLVCRNLSDWVGDQVLFSANGQVWGLHLAASNWKASGPARRLTSGSNTATWARASKASLLVLNSAQLSKHLWKLHLDLRTGKVQGEMERLPHSGGSQGQPSSSADGRLLAYSQSDPAGRSVRLRDLSAGKERTLVSAPGRPKVSPDGAQVAYGIFPDSLYLMPSGGGESTLLVPPQGKYSSQIYAWTADSKKIVYWWGKPIRFGLLDPQTRQSTVLVAHAKYDIHSAELSPDQRWVAFNTVISARQKPLWVAACRGGKVADEKDWIRVSMEGDERPWWSPDGNLLYLVSWRDGAQCIWAQRMHPITKRPVGESFPVYHIHGARLKVPSGGLATFGPAILPDGIIFGLDEETGNVWLAERKE